MPVDQPAVFFWLPLALTASFFQEIGGETGVVIGETTFGKGTVQSLLDLDDYAPSDKPGMGAKRETVQRKVMFAGAGGRVGARRPG